MGKVIGIISLKGGVGKTTSVCSLGGALANEFGKKVLVVDANYSVPNVGLHIGCVKPEKTIHDVLLDHMTMESAVYNSNHGFSVVLGSLLGKDVNPLRLKEKIAQVKDKYDFVLLDSSPALNNEILSVMMASDELFVVTTPDYPTLSCTLKAVKIAKNKGTPITGLILNKIRKEDYEITLEEIEKAAGCNVLAALPDETDVLRALANTTPSTIINSKNDSTIEYKKLAAALLGHNYQDTRLKSRIKRFFNRGLEKQDINRSIMRSRNNLTE